MQLTGKNFIAGDLQGGGESFRAENPATRKNLDPDFYEATTEQISLAITEADKAFQIYSNKTGVERAEFLETIAEEINGIGDLLISRCMEETGLPESRLIGERARTVNQLRLFAGLLREGSWVDARIDMADADRKPLPKPDVRSMLRPLGAVGIFGASNFPFAFSVAGGDTVSALAAGCPVIVKAHPAHPGTCELVGMAIRNAVTKTGMPAGVFSMLHGRSTRVGLGIVSHPLIKAVGFTGSFKGGKALFDEASKRPVPIPVFSEMGSTNPVFILPGVMQEKNESLAKDLASSVTLGVGQFCTNPGLVFIERSNTSDSFRKLLSQSIEQTNSGVMLTSAMKENFESGIERLKKINHVSLVSQGKPLGDGYVGIPHLLQTTASAFLKDRSLEEEIFGPSTLLIEAESRDQLMQAVEKLGGHLTATVHGTEKDLWDYKDLILALSQKVGRVVLNGFPTGVEVCHSMVHGGPFPATTDSRTTSVGTGAILRFVRPMCFQNFPDNLLPEELGSENPLAIWRLVNGERKK